MRNLKYINIEAVRELENTITSKRIREEFSIRDVAFTSRKMRQLFSANSYKFDLKNGKKIVTKGVYLAPSNEAGKGINTCPNATKLCRSLCLIYSGQMKTGTAPNSRVQKTRFFYGYPIQFLNKLIDEMFELGNEALFDGDILQIRLNGTSDIKWEKYLNMELLIQDVPQLTKFYDYTKNPSRDVNSDVYHLTYSLSERASSLSQALDYLAKGQSVAVVTSKTEKAELLAHNNPYIIDGDLSDHRPQDPKGSIVLLSYKGKGATKKQRGTEDGFIKSKLFVESLIALSSGIIEKVRQCEHS